MKRFRFTLQVLLIVREREEQRTTELYAAALRVRRRTAEALATIEAEVTHAAAALREHLAGHFRAMDLAQRQDHFRLLETRQDRANEALKAAEAAVGPALQKMLDARRQREVVEECRRKQCLRHERELVRQDDKLQDELALRRVAPVFGRHRNQ